MCKSDWLGFMFSVDKSEKLDKIYWEVSFDS